MKIEYVSGSTQIDSDEAAGLRLTHITTLNELNIFEQQNIQQAIVWAFGSRKKNILSESFIRQLHQRMFGDVWRWAGEYRTSNKNIGVMREVIGIELRHLCDDTDYWIEHGTFPPDEIAARFHYRIVAIHPFANGNGRHGRLITDLLLEKKLNRPRFSWGGASLDVVSDFRSTYIKALQAANLGDYLPLMAFVRS